MSEKWEGQLGWGACQKGVYPNILTSEKWDGVGWFAGPSHFSDVRKMGYGWGGCFHC